jgi:hypothetical protein
MKNFSGWNDLSDYGIRYLTGERDPYGIRVLCDLTEDGAKLLEEFFCTNRIMFQAAWNSGAVASVMLPHSIWKDLVDFIILHVEKCRYRIKFQDGSVTGYNKDMNREEIEKWGWQVKTNFNQHGGNTNTHAFTGRG